MNIEPSFANPEIEYEWLKYAAHPTACQGLHTRFNSAACVKSNSKYLTVILDCKMILLSSV